MTGPLVTIGIPTYNRAGHYLASVLSNVLGQTYANLEVLVADNCSTDSTSELVRSFSDPRLRYVRHAENIGWLANYNFLVQEAQGAYLHIHNDDDRIDPDFIESCLAAADYRPSVGLIVTGARVIDSESRVVRTRENLTSGLSLEDFILMWYRQRLNLFQCCCLYGTEVLRHHGGFRAEFGRFVDVAAEFCCAATGGRIDVREAKADLREHANSQTSCASIEEWCRSSLALLELACSLMGKREGELRTVGFQTSAARNYRYALQAKGKWQRLVRSWTVFRHFGFRQLPDRGHLAQLFVE